jgi:hypothetical protein
LWNITMPCIAVYEGARYRSSKQPSGTGQQPLSIHVQVVAWCATQHSTQTMQLILLLLTRLRLLPLLPLLLLLLAAHQGEYQVQVVARDTEDAELMCVMVTFDMVPPSTAAAAAAGSSSEVTTSSTTTSSSSSSEGSSRNGLIAASRRLLNTH